MKTTYTAMIANLDNINYVGRPDRPVKRVNSMYEVIMPNNGGCIHTEYSNNEAAALKACRYRYSIVANRIVRMAEDCPEELDRLKGVYIRKTDRDGVVSILIL